MLSGVIVYYANNLVRKDICLIVTRNMVLGRRKMITLIISR